MLSSDSWGKLWKNGFVGRGGGGGGVKLGTEKFSKAPS